MNVLYKWGKQVENSFFERSEQVSHEENLLIFIKTGCLIGILTMVYYNPHITELYSPLIYPKQPAFFHCSGRCCIVFVIICEKAFYSLNDCIMLCILVFERQMRCFGYIIISCAIWFCHYYVLSCMFMLPCLYFATLWQRKHKTAPQNITYSHTAKRQNP